jgi:hypothetical protein
MIIDKEGVVPSFLLYFFVFLRGTKFLLFINEKVQATE